MTDYQQFTKMLRSAWIGFDVLEYRENEIEVVVGDVYGSEVTFLFVKEKLESIQL